MRRILLVGAWLAAWMLGAARLDAQEIPQPRTGAATPPPGNGSGSATAAQPAPPVTAPPLPVVADEPGPEATTQPAQPSAVYVPAAPIAEDGAGGEMGSADALGVTGPQPTVPGYGLEAESLPAETRGRLLSGLPRLRLGPDPGRERPVPDGPPGHRELGA